jgi:hypothetical protein
LEAIREKRPPISDTAQQLELSNNSIIRVATSHRSGTLQLLHVSEYGKMCAQFPEKAREVRTGVFNAVETGGTVFIESTAEGQEGDFYDKCQTRADRAADRRRPDADDFKFHFYP